MTIGSVWIGLDLQYGSENRSKPIGFVKSKTEPIQNISVLFGFRLFWIGWSVFFWIGLDGNTPSQAYSSVWSEFSECRGEEDGDVPDGHRRLPGRERRSEL